MATFASIEKENSEINNYVKEYLKFNGFANTLECFEAEHKTKQVTNKLTNKNRPVGNKEDLPRIYSLFKSEGVGKSKNEINMEKDLKSFNKKYQQILQAGRQIFSVSINLLQLIHSMKEVESKVIPVFKERKPIRNIRELQNPARKISQGNNKRRKA